MCTEPTLRELDHRANDGIDVWLLWRSTDGRLLVAVADAERDEGFMLDVEDGQNALDVFHHPYAYRGDRYATITG